MVEQRERTMGPRACLLGCQKVKRRALRWGCPKVRWMGGPMENEKETLQGSWFQVRS
jgi:hypothetical protein